MFGHNVKEIKKLNPEPLEIQHLLNEFKEIDVDDIPTIFPPL